MRRPSGSTINARAAPDLYLRAMPKKPELLFVRLSLAGNRKVLSARPARGGSRDVDVLGRAARWATRHTSCRANVGILGLPRVVASGRSG